MPEEGELNKVLQFVQPEPPQPQPDPEIRISVPRQGRAQVRFYGISADMEEPALMACFTATAETYVKFKGSK